MEHAEKASVVPAQARTFTNWQGEKMTIADLVLKRKRIKMIRFLYLSCENAYIISHEIRHEMSIGLDESGQGVRIIFNSSREYERIADGSFDPASLQKACLRAEDFYQFIVPLGRITEMDW